MGPACSTHSVPHTGPSGSVPVAARAVAVSMCQGRRACAFQHPGVAGGGAGGLAPLGAPGAGLQAAALPHCPTLKLLGLRNNSLTIIGCKLLVTMAMTSTSNWAMFAPLYEETVGRERRAA